VPPETKVEPSSSVKAGISSQNEILFMRGNAMSGAPIMIGTNQLPKPPIIAGMTMKNTMIRPCAVISTFQKWSASSIVPGPCRRRRPSCRDTGCPDAPARPRIMPEIRRR
jgi:hypothetical protein